MVDLRRPVILYPLLAAGLVAAGLGIHSFISNRPVAVEVVAAEKHAPVRVFGLGTVEARIRSDVSFEVGATLVDLAADEGDHVGRGELLASLGPGEQQARLEKARASLLVTEANAAKAAANLEKARAILAQKREASSRRQALAGRSVVSEQSAEEAIRDEAVAAADVAVASSDVEVAKAQLVDARAQLQFEQTMLGHRRLYAPYDAIIIDRHREVGSVVKAGDPIFTLIARDSYWGLAHVDEARAGNLEEGQRVEARMRSRQQESFTGRVFRIGLESDRVTEERRVFVKGDNPPARIFLGEQVEFWITVAEIHDALLVAEAAVSGFDGTQGTVWTVEDGRLHRRLVSFGYRTEDARLQIVGGLTDRARVVSRIVGGLREGRAARIASTGGT